MEMDYTIKQNIWFLTMGVTVVLTGCTTSPASINTEVPPTHYSRNNAVLQAAHSQVEAIKSDMARVQIEAAKQKAELFSAHQEIRSLRKTHKILQNSHARQLEKINEQTARLQTFTEEREQISATRHGENIPNKKIASLLTVRPNAPLLDSLAIRIERLETNLQQLMQDRAGVHTSLTDAKDYVSSLPPRSNIPSPLQSTRLHQRANLASPSLLILSGSEVHQNKVGLIIVEDGDTLSKLSRRHGSTVQKIKLMNHLISDVIYIGQELRIPLLLERDSLATLPQLGNTSGRD